MAQTRSEQRVGRAELLPCKPSVYTPQTTRRMAKLQGTYEILIVVLHILKALHNLQNIIPDIISFHCHSHYVGLVWSLLFCK